MAPCGARLPRIILSPGSILNGSSKGRMIRPSGGGVSPQDLGDRLAGHCDRARVQARRDLLHHSPGAAGFLQLPYTVGSVGPNFTQTSDASSVLSSKMLVMSKSSSASVTTAARWRTEFTDPPDCEVDLDGVREGHGGEHVPSTQILPHHLNDSTAGRSGGNRTSSRSPRGRPRCPAAPCPAASASTCMVFAVASPAHPRGLDRRLRHLAELF